MCARTFCFLQVVAASLMCVIGPNSGLSAATEALGPWRAGVKVRPVSLHQDRHTIHSYFITCPESPDGRWVLFYASTTTDAQEGELRILNRETNEEKLLARNVTVEDAHRAACQQWISQGRRVVFHDVRNGEWLVVSVEVATLEERILARGRQLGWGQPDAHIVPIYGPHWNPGAHRDLELLNVETGEIRTALSADAVRAQYPDWMSRTFGYRRISVFFPVLSPDLNRAFFKIATPAGGDFRSAKASIRKGLVCYDLAQSRFLFMREGWGHPAWHPDSRTIIETPNILIDSDTGKHRKIPDLPDFPGSHPSVSPDGRLFTSDTRLEPFGGGPSEWGVVVGDINGKTFEIVHRFENSRGAQSWRKSQPHPVFSRDGRRLYFNINGAKWTQLHVAEAGGQ